MSLAKWKEDVKRIMLERYGLQENDIGDEYIESSFNSGETPEAFADYYGEKFDLDRIDDGGWGNGIILQSDR